MAFFSKFADESAFWHQYPQNGAFNSVTREHGWSQELLSSLDRHALGTLGENIVARWAEACGFQILFRQIRHIGFELDLVARKTRELRIIEVKTRMDPPHEPDLHTMTGWLNKRKRIALKRGADFILQKMGSATREIHAISFDLLVVDIGKRNKSISVYRWPDVLS